MPVSFDKRIRKYRGRRCRGYGRIGAHRAKGQRGGTGLTTGLFKYKWSYYLKQKKLGFPDPAWIIGKYGNKTPQELQRIYKINALNIKDLEIKIDQWVKEGKVEKKGSSYIVDLQSLNFQKLLGSGTVSKKLDITVKYASKKAVEKLEAAGCKIQLTAPAK